MLCASSFYKDAPMTQDSQPPRRNLKQVRILLWVLVALAVVGTAAILLYPRGKASPLTTQGHAMGDGVPQLSPDMMVVPVSRATGEPAATLAWIQAAAVGSTLTTAVPSWASSLR